MKGDADIARAAALMADPTRATMLLELADGRALPPSELASRARVSRATVSEHLGKLLDGGFLAVERGGRNRYYRISDPAVAHAIEALAAVSPARPVASLREAAHGDAIRAARTCYGHLAGAAGVALADGLLRERLIVRDGERIELTEAGRERFSSALGLELPRAGRGALGKPCNDWSERRPHVAGPVGVALTRRMFEVRWLERIGSGRAVRLTDAGRRGMAEAFGVDGLP